MNPLRVTDSGPIRDTDQLESYQAVESARPHTGFKTEPYP